MSAPETHLCARRQSVPPAPFLSEHDTWRVEPNGDRTCSFCGSLHPDDWLRLMRDAMDPASETRIEASTKGYKFYVHQKGVQNSMEGGIKFYAWHIPSDEWAAEANKIHPDVMRASAVKFAAQMQRLGLRAPE